jgi:hypothetical protein
MSVLARALLHRSAVAASDDASAGDCCTPPPKRPSSRPTPTTTPVDNGSDDATSGLRAALGALSIEPRPRRRAVSDADAGVRAREALVAEALDG